MEIIGKTIPKETKEEMVLYYKSKPMSYQDVADKFNYSLPTIGKIFREYRIKPYSKVQLFSPELQENYFEDIDDEYKAYFLGLIITDGCIYKKWQRQSVVSITLQDRDRYLIDEFVTKIKSNKAVTSDGRGCGSINILSDKMVSDLEKYGLSENKSLRTIFPKNIPDNMYPHLIRVLLDGDGSIGFYSRPKRKSHTKSIRFCQGNKQFIVDLMDYLESELNIKPVNITEEKSKGNLWSIAYHKNKDILKLTHFLYSDASIYMVRKKEILNKIVDEILYYHGNTEITDTVKIGQHCKA